MLKENNIPSYEPAMNFLHSNPDSLEESMEGNIWITRYVPGIKTMSNYLSDTKVNEEDKYMAIESSGRTLGRMHQRSITLDDPSPVNLGVKLDEPEKIYVGPFDFKTNEDMPLDEKKARELLQLPTTIVHWAKGLDPEKARDEFFKGYFQEKSSKDFLTDELKKIFYAYKGPVYRLTVLGIKGSYKKTRDHLIERFSKDF